MKKKIFLGMGAITPVALVATTSINYTKPKQDEIKELLKFPEETFEKISKFSNEKLEQIFNKLSNSESVKDFITNIEPDDTYGILSYKIASLGLDNDETLILTSKVIQKITLKRKNSVPRTWKIYQKEDRVLNNEKLTIKSANGDLDVLYKNKEIEGHGYNDFYVIDNVFDMDESYISWSNQKVLNYILNYSSKIIQEQVEVLESDDFVDFDKWLKTIQEQNDLLLKDFQFTKTNVPNLLIRIKSYTNDLVKKMNYLKSLKNANYISRAIDEILDIFNITKRFLARSDKYSVIYNHFQNLWNDLKITKQDLTNFNLKTSLKKAKTLLKGLTYVTMAIDGIKLLISTATFVFDMTDNHLNMNAFKNAAFSLGRLISSGLKFAGTLFPVLQAGAIVFDIVDLFLNEIKLGNGFTIYENMHDHGLNDWDFQIKNNFKTMVQIAARNTDNLRKGVVWKVTDGWFSYPNLYITQQIDGDIKPDNYPRWVKWDLLSPGNEFNFGNKIKDIYERK